MYINLIRYTLSCGIILFDYSAPISYKFNDVVESVNERSIVGVKSNSF